MKDSCQRQPIHIVVIAMNASASHLPKAETKHGANTYLLSERHLKFGNERDWEHNDGEV